MAKRNKKRLPKRAKSRVKARPIVQKLGRGKDIIVESNVLNSARILILTAGILNIVTGIIYAIFWYLSDGLVSQTWYAVANIVIGLFMLLSLNWLYHKPRPVAVWILLLSLLTFIFPPWGIIVGPIFGLIAAILVLVKSRAYY